MGQAQLPSGSCSDGPLVHVIGDGNSTRNGSLGAGEAGSLAGGKAEPPAAGCVQPARTANKPRVRTRLTVRLRLRGGRLANTAASSERTVALPSSSSVVPPGAARRTARTFPSWQAAALGGIPALCQVSATQRASCPIHRRAQDQSGNETILIVRPSMSVKSLGLHV